MKTLRIFLALTLLLSLLAGCARNMPQDENGNITPEPSSTATGNQDQNEPVQPDPAPSVRNQACQYLEKLWEAFPQENRFAAYGGTVESGIENMPGDLDMENTQELTAKYLLPEDSLAQVSEGASLVHMMNSNVFTAAVVKVKDSQNLTPLYEAWRDKIQSNQWICGQPDRLVMAKLDSQHLLMAFGSAQNIEQLAGNLETEIDGGEILYHQAVVS